MYLEANTMEEMSLSLLWEAMKPILKSYIILYSNHRRKENVKQSKLEKKLNPGTQRYFTDSSRTEQLENALIHNHCSTDREKKPYLFLKQKAIFK